MKIGDFEEGESVTIGLTLTRNDLYFREAQFVYCDPGMIEQDIGRLLEANKDTVAERVNPTYMKVTVNAPEEKLLFTSLPVEKGWEITVDGVKTDYVEILDALIAVPVTAGSHTIEFKFTTAGYPEALIISGTGLALFIAMIFIYYKFFYSRKNGKIVVDGKKIPVREAEE